MTVIGAISGAAGDLIGNAAPHNNTQFVVVRIDANNQSDDVNLYENLQQR